MLSMPLIVMISMLLLLLLPAGRVVFVDQAPLQNRTPDWNLGIKGCHHATILTQLQHTLMTNLEAAVADGNAASGCLHVPQGVLQVLHYETKRCKSAALAALLADHTQLGWRALLPQTKIPCLGGTSGVLPVQGYLEVGPLHLIVALWYLRGQTIGCISSSLRSIMGFW